MIAILRRMLLGLGLLAAPACSTAWFVEDADREVDGLLSEFDHRTLGDRDNWIRQPLPAVEEPEEPAEEGAAGASDSEAPQAVGEVEDEEVIELTLESSLSIALQSSRDYISRKESLYLQGLSYSLTLFNFGPQLNGTISYLLADSEQGSRSYAVDTFLGASQILPTGGTVSLSGRAGTDHIQGPHTFNSENRRSYSSSAGVSLSQPLLRGAGYEVSHEGLTQGERNLVYEVRSFELFRQDFAIGVAENYFNLARDQKQLSNDEVDFTQAVFDQEKAEALRKVDRNTDQDVILARRRKIDTETRLIGSRTNLQDAIDRFRIDLGLPPTTNVVVIEQEPPFQAVRLDPDSAVEVTLHNRLDLQTAREQLEDVERGLRISRNGLLPDLDLTGAWNFAGSDRHFDQASPDLWSASAGLTLEIPLQRKAERNAYRSALIGLERQRRSYQELLDDVDRDIRNQLRRLDQLEQQIGLQEEQIEQTKKDVTVTQIRYESGSREVQARDLLDARQALINAQNALLDLKASHFIERLRLRRDLGVFIIDETGMWQ
jgi:outer membrane protein TolC